MTRNDPFGFDISAASDKKRRTKGKRGMSGAFETSTRACDHRGCDQAGQYRAPKSPDTLDDYFWFCRDHVREYNQTYNYFDGMTDEAVARWMKSDVIGHRPTWAMGVNRAGKSFREDNAGIRDPLGAFGDRMRGRQPEAPVRPSYGIAARKALSALGLDETADAAAIKARYKDLVKRLHPDANGGDRSSEDKLREIIRAYNYLRSAKLA